MLDGTEQRCFHTMTKQNLPGETHDCQSKRMLVGLCASHWLFVVVSEHRRLPPEVKSPVLFTSCY